MLAHPVSFTVVITLAFRVPTPPRAKAVEKLGAALIHLKTGLPSYRLLVKDKALGLSRLSAVRLRQKWVALSSRDWAHL